MPANMDLVNTEFRADISEILSHHFTDEEMEAQKGQVTCSGNYFSFDVPHITHTHCSQQSSSSFSPYELFWNSLSWRMSSPTHTQTATPESWESPWAPLPQSQVIHLSPPLANCRLSISPVPSSTANFLFVFATLRVLKHLSSPDQGSHPHPQQWKGYILSTGPPGNSQQSSLRIPAPNH